MDDFTSYSARTSVAAKPAMREGIDGYDVEDGQGGEFFVKREIFQAIFVIPVAQEEEKAPPEGDVVQTGPVVGAAP